MADTYTKIADLIDPEVMGDMVSARIPKKLRVAPFAKVDDTLAGVPGDTITVPAYAYIGDADIDECANVSSVFHNRLKDSASFPKLESDVTTFYVSQNLKDVIGYQDGVALENQNDEVKKYMELYSTYYREGLPVGPICNPGLKAINAALHPADTNYVFFLTDKSGEHFYYASTIAEHNANGVKAGLF